MRDNDSKSIDDTIEVLIIDIKFLLSFPLNQENLNIETFITSFRIIHLAKTMTTNLANRFFDYTIHNQKKFRLRLL